MATGTQTALTYQKLAEWYDRKGQPQQRDRFLVLAADAAQAAGSEDEAESLRLRLLRHNPHHLLRPYTSFTQAMNSADVQSYVNDLRNSYPPKKAADMLDSLGPQAAQAASDKPIPPTQPVVDLDAEPAKRSIPSKEPLKVYRVQEESAARPTDRARPDAPPAPARNPASQPTASRPAPARPPAPPPRPAPIQPVYGVVPELRETRPTQYETSRQGRTQEEASAGWVGAALFVLVLAASLAIGVYGLALPMIWGR
jgi:hypothetical protein